MNVANRNKMYIIKDKNGSKLYNMYNKRGDYWLNKQYTNVRTI